jgi:hypothetical protein
MYRVYQEIRHTSTERFLGKFTSLYPNIPVSRVLIRVFYQYYKVGERVFSPYQHIVLCVPDNYVKYFAKRIKTKSSPGSVVLHAGQEFIIGCKYDPVGGKEKCTYLVLK